MTNGMNQTDLFMQTFGDMDNDEYYPGSDQKRRESAAMKKERKAQERKKERALEDWDAHPVRRTVRVEEKPVTVELFTIGALAKALGKKPVTLRKWMAKGWLPQAQYREKLVGGAGQRRYWSRQQIEIIHRIAKEEGLLDVWQPDVQQLFRFSQRVKEAFRRGVG
jgi:hypothetical protein